MKKGMVADGVQQMPISAGRRQPGRVPAHGGRPAIVQRRAEQRHRTSLETEYQHADRRFKGPFERMDGLQPKPVDGQDGHGRDEQTRPQTTRPRRHGHRRIQQTERVVTRQQVEQRQLQCHCGGDHHQTDPVPARPPPAPQPPTRFEIGSDGGEDRPLKDDHRDLQCRGRPTDGGPGRGHAVDFDDRR